MISNSEIPYIANVVDVKASRVLDTTYTNNTGKTLIVSIVGQHRVLADLDKARHLFWVDGIIVSLVGYEQPAGMTGYIFLSLIGFVPPGSTYKLTRIISGTGDVQINKWFEAY